MTADQVIVRMEHARKLRYCAKGIRALCERHGLDYNDFLANGISASKLLSATGNDAMAIAVVEEANRE